MKGKKRSRIKRQQLIFIWSMLALPILGLLVFYVYVNLNSFLLAFKNIDYSKDGKEYWTLQNFVTVFKMFKGEIGDSDLLLYGINTMKFWLLSVCWNIPFSILTSYVFYRKLRGHKVFRVLLYIPTIMSSVALAGIFASIIDTTGAFGYILQNFFHMERVPGWLQEAEYVVPTLLVYNWFFGMAGHYILYSGAIANIDEAIIEAAHIDGVSMWQEIWHICIPLMWPTISMTIVTSFAGIFGASGPILVLAPNMKEAWTFGYWIYDQVRRYNAYYIPSALGWCFSLIAFPVCLYVKKVVNKIYTTE